MYEIGKVYIWQNQVGAMAFLNGSECTVLAAPEMHYCVIKQQRVRGQLTDTTCRNDNNMYFAEAGDLRLKEPPAGERGVMDLFKMPELGTA